MVLVLATMPSLARRWRPGVDLDSELTRDRGSGRESTRGRSDARRLELRSRTDMDVEGREELLRRIGRGVFERIVVMSGLEARPGEVGVVGDVLEEGRGGRLVVGGWLASVSSLPLLLLRSISLWASLVERGARNWRCRVWGSMGSAKDGSLGRCLGAFGRGRAAGISAMPSCSSSSANMRSPMSIEEMDSLAWWERAKDFGEWVKRMRTSSSSSLSERGGMGEMDMRVRSSTVSSSWAWMEKAMDGVL